MTPHSDVDSLTTPASTTDLGLETNAEPRNRNLEDEYLEDLPDEVEMSLFEHLEELRQRIFYALIAVVLSMIGCFAAVKPIVQLLEVPAQGVKFLQLAPGEYFLFPSKLQAIAACSSPVPLCFMRLFSLFYQD